MCSNGLWARNPLNVLRSGVIPFEFKGCKEDVRIHEGNVKELCPILPKNRK
jgi:hypothetical protein